MIKKAVFLTLTAPFLMVFSYNSYSFDIYKDIHPGAFQPDFVDQMRDRLSGNPSGCHIDSVAPGGQANRRGDEISSSFIITHAGYRTQFGKTYPIYNMWRLDCPRSVDKASIIAQYDIPEPGYPMSDESCQAAFGGTRSISFSSYSSTGSYIAPGGACSVTSSGVDFCYVSGPV